MALEYATIKNKTATTRQKQSRFGLQTAALKLNNDDIPIDAINSVMYVHDDLYLDTQFVPNMSKYTIIQKVHGDLEVLDQNGQPTGTKTKRSEERKLERNKGVIKYYIDGTLQNYSVSAPSPTKTLKISNTPVIGYKDKIEYVAYFKVMSY